MAKRVTTQKSPKSNGKISKAPHRKANAKRVRAVTPKKVKASVPKRGSRVVNRQKKVSATKPKRVNVVTPKKVKAVKAKRVPATTVKKVSGVAAKWVRTQGKVTAATPKRARMDAQRDAFINGKDVMTTVVSKTDAKLKARLYNEVMTMLCILPQHQFQLLVPLMGKVFNVPPHRVQ